MSLTVLVQTSSDSYLLFDSMPFSIHYFLYLNTRETICKVLGSVTSFGEVLRYDDLPRQQAVGQFRFREFDNLGLCK
ncbi:hypothetical protein VDT1_1231 [Vibrio sp. 16]|nr:hypothetical protein VDT1_1231 [Vibrio sp. 16]